MKKHQKLLSVPTYSKEITKSFRETMLALYVSLRCNSCGVILDFIARRMVQMFTTTSYHQNLHAVLEDDVIKTHS